MKIVIHLFNIAAIVLLFSLIAIYVNLMDSFDRDFDQDRLDKSVEFATRAMFMRIIELGNIEASQENGELIEASVHGMEALNVYSRVMCANYGVPQLPQNLEAIQAMSLCLVVSGEGFYITQSEQAVWDENSASDPPPNYGNRTVFSPLQPFTVKSGDTVYAVNILEGNSATISMNANGEPAVTGKDSALPASVDRPAILREANKQITRAIVYAMEELGRNMGGEYRFNMPSELTLLGINPIQSATVMVFIEGFNLDTLQSLSSYAATGYEAVPARPVYGFELDGIKYYSYSTQHMGGDSGGKYPYERIFKDMEEAANAGYSPHSLGLPGNAVVSERLLTSCPEQALANFIDTEMLM